MQLSYRTVCFLALCGDPQARSFVYRWKMRNPERMYWSWDANDDTLYVANMPQKK